MALSLMNNAHNETVPGRLDVVKSYTLTTKRGSPDDVKTWINSNWMDDTCAAAITWTALLPLGCKAKREDIQTNVKKLMECDKYGSPACACVNKAVSGLAVTATTGIVMTGKKDSLITSIYNCADVYHNSVLAKQTERTWFLRSGIHLMLSTLLWFQIVFNTFLNPWIEATTNDTYRRLLWWGSRAWILAGPIIAFFVNFAFLSQTSTFMALITFVPLVLFVWFEFLLPTDVHKPWVHPYYFAIFLSCFSILSLIENGILNYQNLIVEFLKAQATSYLYLATVWIYAYKQESRVSGVENDPTRELLHTKPVSEAHLLTVCLAAFIYINNQLVPYANNGWSLFLWYCPSIFVLLTFGSITWIESLGLSPFYGKDRKSKEDTNTQAVSENDEATSLLLIALVGTVAFIFLAEHASVYRAFFDKLPEYSSIDFDTRVIPAIGAGYRAVTQ